MKLEFRLDGGRAVLDTLADLPKPTRRNLLMRTMRTEIEPLAAAVRAKAPYLWGDLEQGLHIGPSSKLTRRQRGQDREIMGPNAAVLHFGTADPAGMMNEFGLGNNPPQPFFRSEWESRKMGILRGIGQTLGSQIEAAAARRARKLARTR